MSPALFRQSLLTIAITSTLAACGGDDNNDKTSAIEALGISCQASTAATSTPTGTLSMELVGTYASDSEFASGAAEIVSYDSCSGKLYVVNAQQATVDVLSLSSSGVPSHTGTINLNTASEAAGIEIGAANSVSAKQGLVAVAIEAANKQDAGLIALYRSDTLELLGTYSAGSLPDMVTLSADGEYILSANEGEPSSDYSVDPQGSVTIVDISAGFAADKAVVHQVGFTDFNTGASRASELPAAVRITGPAGTTVAQDLEPEYLTLSKDGKTAWVSLQENNAIAIIDVKNASVSAIKALGEKSWNSASGNQLDASNKDAGPGEFASYEQLAGLYMPDTLASFEVNGATYILSANEGDGREYGDYLDEARGGDLYDKVDDAHPLKAALDDNDQLKRLKFVDDRATIAATDTLYAFGARSFSIWNSSAELVFDSGDDIAQRVYAADPDHFNSDHESNDSADSRSDDKGTEPEAIEAATIGNRTFAFVGLERQSGVLVYEVTDPTAPVFQSMLNNRDFSQPVCTEVNEDGECSNGTYNSAAGDLGPESIDYFSTNGEHFIAVGNEVSGTTSVYRLGFGN